MAMKLTQHPMPITTRRSPPPVLTSAEFIDLINFFLIRHEISPSAFGRILFNDPTWVFQLREGRKPNLDTVNKIINIIMRPQACNLFGRPPPKKGQVVKK